MDASPFTAVARVVKARGLSGAVTLSVLFDADPASVLGGIDLWPVPPRNVPRPLHLDEVSAPGDHVVATFREIRDASTANRLVGATLLAHASHVPRHVHAPATSIVGWTVVDSARGSLGTIDDVIHTKANDVWVVRGQFGEVLVPVIDDVVLSLDPNARTAAVRLLPGLLDER